LWFFFYFFKLDFCNDEVANSYCNSCKKSCCEECLDFIHRKGEKKNHLEKEITELSNISLKCSSHHQELVAFCVDCTQFTCLSCVLHQGLHANHNVTTFEGAEEHIKKITIKHLENLKTTEDALKNRIERLTDEQKKLHLVIDLFYDSQFETIKNLESTIDVISKSEKPVSGNFPLCLQLMKIESEKDKSLEMDHEVIHKMIDDATSNENNFSFLIHCKDCIGKSNEKSCLKCFLKDHHNHQLFHVEYNTSDCACKGPKIQEEIKESPTSSGLKTFTFEAPKKEEVKTGFTFGTSDNQEIIFPKEKEEIDQNLSYSFGSDLESSKKTKIDFTKESTKSEGFDFGSPLSLSSGSSLKKSTGFDFGGNSTSSSSSSGFGSFVQTSKPTFSFGGPTTTTTSFGSSSFGETSNDNLDLYSKSISFGAPKSPTKSGFYFGEYEELK
jgi:hypothetical protein